MILRATFRRGFILSKRANLIPGQGPDLKVLQNYLLLKKIFRRHCQELSFIFGAIDVDVRFPGFDGSNIVCHQIQPTPATARMMISIAIKGVTLPSYCFFIWYQRR